MKLNRMIVIMSLCVLFSHSVHAMWQGVLAKLPVVGGYFAPAHSGVVAECEALYNACAEDNVRTRIEALGALKHAVLVTKKDINGTDESGRSGLSILGEYVGSRAKETAPCDEIVKGALFLLKKKAEVTKLRFMDDSNLLHLAAENGYHELIIPLEVAGLDVNAPDSDERTPLYRAAANAAWCKKRGRGNIVQCMDTLLGLKADVNKKSKSGNTPLHWADTQETIELLIRDNADVEAVNCVGQTPLHAAVANGMVEQVKTLLAHSANLHAEDPRGRTPLQVAEEERVSAFYSQATKKQIIDLLTNAGAAGSDAGCEEKD